MLTSVLLALAPVSEGQPRYLASTGSGVPVVRGLARQLDGYGDVVVLALHEQADAVTTAIGDSAEVVPVAGIGDAASWLADRPDGGELLLVSADIVTAPTAIERVADDAASGTWALVGPPASVPDGVPVRVARGRVRAAASAYHRIQSETNVGRGALRVAARDVGAMKAVARELASALDEPVEAWRDELARKVADADLGAPTPDARATLDPTALEHDLLSLLLVGLVRADTSVGAVTLPPRLPWVRVRGDEDAVMASEAVATTDEERVRLDAAVKAEDGFFTTFFVSVYSRYWARWCARRGLTPNQVTTASMLLAILAAGAFAVGDLTWAIAGAVLLQLSFTLDCVDGQLARYTRNFSDFGAWLDSVFDRAKEYVVFVGLVIGGINAGGESTLWVLAVAALTLQTFRHALDFGYAVEQRAAADRVPSQDLREVDEAGTTFWESAPSSDRDERVGTGLRSSAGAVIGSLRRAESVPVLKWAKRIVVLPIGERFALISLVTPLAGPRWTFLILLVWGGVAMTYTFGGRLVRSVS